MIRRSIHILFLAIVITAVPAAVFAAEQQFFDFATDVGKPLAVPSGSVATQSVKIINDSMGAVDLWFDNAGAAGSATVGIRDGSNTLLASKTVAIPHKTPFYSGERLHVSFDRPIALYSGNWYTITVASAASELRLYTIPRVTVLEHNAPYELATLIGGSTLDGAQRDAAYKFALYETVDTEAPIVTNATTSIGGPNTMTVSFNANELVDRSISYGPVGSSNIVTVPYGGNYSICSEGIYTCSVALAVDQGTAYNYRLSVRDSWGNTTFVDGSFESWKPSTPAPTVPPAEQQIPAPSSEEQPQQLIAPPLYISDAAPIDITANGVSVHWRTNRAADSVLTVSTDPLGANPVGDARDATAEFEHMLVFSGGLTSSTSYYATIVSHTPAGSSAAQTLRFSTLRKTAAAPTAKTPVQSMQASASERGSVDLSWAAPTSGGEPIAGYRVDIFTKDGQLARTQDVPSGIHTLSVSGLTSGDYYAVAYRQDGAIARKVDEAKSVSLTARPLPYDTYALIRRLGVIAGSLAFIAVVMGLAFRKRLALLAMRAFPTGRKERDGTEGFTLIELLITFSIFGIVLFVIGGFMKSVFDYQLLFTQQLSAEQEIETTFSTILSEGRSMMASSLGSYPIVAVATSSMTFYSDIDADGLEEQVRYFLSGTTLKKGFVKPSGSPLVYDRASESVSDVVHNVAPGAAIFAYFDANYSGSEPPMAYPIKISDIRMIKVTLTVKDPRKTASSTAAIEIVPRNIRTNI